MVNTRDFSNATTGAKPMDGLNRQYVIRKRIDMTSSGQYASGVTATDIWQIGLIPANTIVKAAHVIVVTNAGATCTVDVGITGTGTAMLSAANVYQAADTLVSTDDGSPLAAFFCTADIEIILTFNHTNSTGIFDVIIECVDCNGILTGK